MKYYTVENENKSIFKTFAIYYIAMSLFCLVRIIAVTGAFPDGKWGEILSSLIIQVGILFLIPFVLYCVFLKVKPVQVFKTCNYYKCNYKVVLISFGIGVLCFFINIAVSSLFNGILSFTGYDFNKFSSSSDSSNMSVGNFFIDLFIVAVLPALCEEFLHRGIVLQGIKHGGFKKAILLSSMLFALLHFNIQQVSYAFVIGLILGFVAVVSKNIWPSVIIHFTNNAISVYLDYASANKWWLGSLLSDIQSALIAGNAAVIFIVCVLILLAVIGLLCLFIWLLYKQSMLKRVYKAIDKVYDNESGVIKDDPIVINKSEAMKDVIENCTLLNLDYHSMENPIDAVLPKEKSRYKVRKTDKIFMWGAVVLGGLVTLFTYIWGLL